MKPYNTRPTWNEITSEFTWEEMTSELIKEEMKDNAILGYVESKVSKGLYKEILEELKESDAFCYEIVKVPAGTLENDCDYEFIEGIYVNQTVNGGYLGDNYSGTCAIKITDNEYLQFCYSTY